MTRPHEDVIREALQARQRGTGSTRNTKPALDALAALVDERDRLRETLVWIGNWGDSQPRRVIVDRARRAALAASPGDKTSEASGPDEQERA